MKKTKALEILTGMGIAHEVRSFAASEFTAEEAARELQLPLGMLFKTLVAPVSAGRRAGGYPRDQTLSLRKLALAMSDKRLIC
jgi:prolyl-tRNA editing enzyme YbaK/EbsC (Cys-tRNA(Pro) deacylase)